MGGEKFHITVTIDNEKALQIAGLPEFSAAGISSSRNKSAIADLGQKNNTRAYPGTTLRLEIFLSRSAIKAADVVGFFPADICVGAVTRCRLRFDSD
jgi:hypothetical protein